MLDGLLKENEKIGAAADILVRQAKTRRIQLWTGFWDPCGVGGGFRECGVTGLTLCQPKTTFWSILPPAILYNEWGRKWRLYVPAQISVALVQDLLRANQWVMPSFRPHEADNLDDKNRLSRAGAMGVRERARELLSQHPYFCGRADDFEFEWIENVLVVRGRVPTYYLKQLLHSALKKLDGVRQIDNCVDVVRPELRDCDSGH